MILPGLLSLIPTRTDIFNIMTALNPTTAPPTQPSSAAIDASVTAGFNQLSISPRRNAVSRRRTSPRRPSPRSLPAPGTAAWRNIPSGFYKYSLRRPAAACPSRIFHKFPELPPELRRKIWATCLPHRVLLFSSDITEQTADVKDDFLVNRTGCLLRNQHKLNLLPPVIAYVCFEAREVVAENRKAFKIPDHLAHFGYLPKTIWIDTQRDTVMLNRRRWALSLCDLNPGHIPASITPRFALAPSMYVDPFNNTHASSYGYDKYPYPLTEDSLVGGKEYPLVVAVVTLHLSFERAMASDLFGLTGQDRNVFIDLADRNKINQVLELRGITDWRWRIDAEDQMTRCGRKNADRYAGRIFARRASQPNRFKPELGFLPRFRAVVMVSMCEAKCDVKADRSPEKLCPMRGMRIYEERLSEEQKKGASEAQKWLLESIREKCKGG